MIKKIDSTEHAEITNHNVGDDLLEKFNESYDKSCPKFLGLHQEYENRVLKSHYYIGYRWLDDEGYIHIAPKPAQKQQADYLKLFLECLKEPIVSKHLDETYKIFFNEKWIEIENTRDEITPLIILHFLKVVHSISKKGLKKGYVKITKNMTSKIKGRILINQTIKQNHFKNRLDKTVCNHQIFTVNCIENQILKTALMQCSRNLHGIQDDDISKFLKLNLHSFELVNTKEIFNSDFSNIKHSPFYKDYKEALRLAKMIFKRFGFNLNSINKGDKYLIPPFYIDMPELFERYVEVKLRKVYKDNLVPGYGQKNGNSYTWKLRPDFIVKKEKLKEKKLIIDAKYKYWFDNNNNNNKDNFKDDYQQLSLYGRVNEIREVIGLENNEEAKILFIYPKIDGCEDINENEIKENKYIDNDFSNINKLGLKIPVKNSTE